MSAMETDRNPRLDSLYRSLATAPTLMEYITLDEPAPPATASPARPLEWKNDWTFQPCLFAVEMAPAGELVTNQTISAPMLPWDRLADKIMELARQHVGLDGDRLATASMLIGIFGWVLLICLRISGY